MKREELKAEVIRWYLRDNEIEKLLLVLVDSNPADLTGVLQKLDMKELRQLVQCLQTPEAAKFFGEKCDKLQAIFNDIVGELYIQRVTKEMFAEDLVD